MISTAEQAHAAQTATREPTVHPTVWGLRPFELHDRYWAARGVQVVRPGRRSELVEDAELFLLLDSQLLTIFRLRQLLDQLSWMNPQVMWVRLRDQRERGYREVAELSDDGSFQRLRRVYGSSDARLSRVALTPKVELARAWQSADSAAEGWQALRREVPRSGRLTATTPAQTFDHDADHEVMAFVRTLVQQWQSPDATVERARKVTAGVWQDPGAEVEKQAHFIGPAWIGAGRSLSGDTTIVGPTVLWDDPDHRPEAEHVDWEKLVPTEKLAAPVTTRGLSSASERFGKRGFDILFASLALAATLPIFPFIMYAIWREDGRPFLFAHTRESRDGRPFKCLKFRSMRKDAEQIKQRLIEQNQVDGPQFYIEDDPRLTRTGETLRKYHLDELPQLFNVLAGHMSIVGPRPSPYKENQYCPAWREARLSVRPGITGLWQVKRTRAAGHDFQEWIKYDLEYVERATFSLDMWIIYRTVINSIWRDK